MPILPRLSPVHPSRANARRPRGRTLRVESLEARVVPAGLPEDLTGAAPVKVRTDEGPPLLRAPDMPALAAMDPALAGAVRHAWQVPVGAGAAEWLIQLPAGQSPKVLAPLGVVSAQAVPFWPNAHAVTFAAEQDVAAFPAALAALTAAEFYYPVAYRMLSTRWVPNDPMFPQQWHLRNTGQRGGTPGEDANLVRAWDVPGGAGPPVRGAGVVIGVVDDGLAHAHPDISANYSAEHSWDFNFNDPDPQPAGSDAHGTAAAGVAAARGDNGVGVTGSAPRASLAGLRLLGSNFGDTEEGRALSHHPESIDIYSNSWGPPDNGRLGPIGPMALAAIRSGAANGRGGLGNVYTWAAGNGLGNNDNVNYDAYANSRHVIAVGAITDTGVQTWYSEPGAAMLVTAHSNGGAAGITTTDLPGAAGYSPTDYANDFGGTSSATPLVSGIIALMLEANPNLSYRDVQHVLVNSARKNHPTDPGWTVNGAGLPVNHKYGFGAVDALAAVNLAKTWTPVAPEVSRPSPRINVNLPVPDNNPSAGVTSTYTMREAITIEHVEVVFNATQTWRGDYRVVLTAPSGTQSVLAETHVADSGDDYTNWVFSSVRHWGESSAGEWSIYVSDGAAADVGNFVDWTLVVYGTPIPVPPVLGGLEAARIDYAAGQGELGITQTLSVSDPDSPTLSRATVTISANYTAGEDVLRFTDQNGITGSFSGGVLTLTGRATPAQYQAALRSVRYENTAPTPSTAARTVTFRVTDPTNLASNALSRNIRVIPFNTQPTLDPVAPADIPEDAGTQTVALAGITAGADESQTLTVTATSSNPELIPDPVVTYASPAATGSLAYTPAANRSGTAVITVTVKDSGGTGNGATDQVTRTFTVTVNSVNDAPTFTPGGDQVVPLDAGPQAVGGWATGISGGPPDEAGQQLTFVTSNDNTSLFAVQPAVGADGTLTYTPAPDQAGTATVTVVLRDDGGTANGGQDTSPPQTFQITVEVNDAPVLDGDVRSRLTPIPRGSTDPAGDAVADVVGTTITDPDRNAVEGIAVIGLAGPEGGVWQYSLDAGASWAPVGPVSVAAARLLRAQDRVRFVPPAGFVGTAEVTYHAWDQTSGAAGDLADLAVRGGRTAFSDDDGTARLRVAMTMATVSEDTGRNVGDQVLSLLGPFLTDPDPLAKRGIAVTDLSGSDLGTWQYSTDAGRTWKPIKATQAGALLLGDRDRVRFVANPNQAGEARFGYHAWDQTSGARGASADLSAPGAVGGGTAFSSQTDVVFVQIKPVNDRPVVDKGWQPSLPNVAPGVPEPEGDTVGGLLGSSVTDPDPGALRGLAVVGASTLGGRWQYRLDGSAKWENLTGLTVRSAVPLRAEDRVRFVPAGSSGTGTLRYKAWDQTAGEAGVLTDTVMGTAFSVGVQTARARVSATPTPVNTAPVLAGASPFLTDTPEDSKPAGDLVSELLGKAMTDPDPGVMPGIAVVGLTETASGRWQFSLSGGGAWADVGAVSTSRALLLREFDRVRFLPNKDFNGEAELTFRGWDGTEGSAGQRADLTVPGAAGGTGPFSTGEVTAKVKVLPANDAPALDTRLIALLPTQPPVLDRNTVPGHLVSTLLANTLTDIDGGDPQGIGVTRAPIVEPAWEYQLEGTTGWLLFPDTTPANPFLLRATDRIRLVAMPTFTGMGTLQFRAWDQSDGEAGKNLPFLGTTALSKAIGTAALSIGSTNSRPILHPKEVRRLAPVKVGDEAPAGTPVSDLLGRSIRDPDAADRHGIAVVAAPALVGRWEFSTNGGVSWKNVGIVSGTKALLLRDQDLVRFVPAAGFRGTARLTYHAWDQTSGTAGSTANPRAAGATAFSTATAVSLVSVNTAPSLDA